MQYQSAHGPRKDNMSDLDLEQLIATAPMGEEIWHECVDLAELLLRKNISYGNSALEPSRIFSRASANEQLLVRLDDKLSRIQRGDDFPGDNDVLDLLGYLILLRISTRLTDVVR